MKQTPYFPLPIPAYPRYKLFHERNNRFKYELSSLGAEIPANDI